MKGFKPSILAFFLVLSVCLCILSCRNGEEFLEVTHGSLSVPHLTDSRVDGRKVIYSAGSEVRKKLPHADLRSFTFIGSCQSLYRLEGVIHLIFVEERWAFPQPKIFEGIVSVDTYKNSMDFRIENVTEHYPSTKPLELGNGLDTLDAAERAYQYITELGISNCDVILSRLDESWYVICTEPGSGTLGKRICEFSIDPTSGEILATP